VDQGFWRQRKVLRRASILLLLVIGVAVGVGVGVGVVVGVGGSNSDLDADSSDFDFSEANTVGCLCIGEVSLGFQDPDSFLVASCMDTNFENPTSDNCDCEVHVPVSTFRDSEHCQSCLFVDDPVGDTWRLAYDCSNILSGDCVGRDTSNNCISRPRLGIETTDELRAAVDEYLTDNSKDTLVARTYGWPIGVWNVSEIQDFSHLFAAYDFPDSERSNFAATSFNEDIAGWDVSNATDMRYKFSHAESFNQPLADWNVSSVKDMSNMFGGASSYNQPLADWNVASVTHRLIISRLPTGTFRV
jgi:surface protein